MCYTFGHAPIWLLLRQRRACPSSWSQAPSWRVWLQKGCLFPQGSTLSAEGLHPPCTRNQTEVEEQSFERTNTTATGLPRRAARLAHVPNCRLFLRKNRGHIHHHCVLDCFCQRSSRSAFHSLTSSSQDLSP